MPQTTADNYVELAVALNVSRQSLYKWAKRKGAPKPRSNGKHSINAWLEFMSRNNLKAEGFDDDTPESECLRGRKLKAEVELAELKVETARGKYIDIERVKSVWTSHISQARKTLENHLLNELPPVLAAMDDAVEIRAYLQNVIDDTYSVLEGAALEMNDSGGVEA